MKERRKSRVVESHWWPDFERKDIPESAWIEVDVDEYWERVDAMPEAELVQELDSIYFWDVTLEYLGISEGEQEEFRAKFFSDTPSAPNSGNTPHEWRQHAIRGLQASRRAEEETLVRAAHAILAARLPDSATGKCPPLYADEEGRKWDEGLLGMEFARLITGSDSVEFCKRLLKGAEENWKRETGSRTSVTWRLFCQFVQAKHRLPTVGEFRDAVGLSSNEGDQVKGNQDMRKFGLKLRKGFE